jgi:hypothetical protein
MREEFATERLTPLDSNPRAIRSGLCSSVGKCHHAAVLLRSADPMADVIYTAMDAAMV